MRFRRSPGARCFCLPFQCSFTVLRFSTLTLGLIGVWALYALIREIQGDVRTALAAAATLAANPLWFALSNTFMTEVPFVALSILAVWCFARGFRRQEQLSLGAGLLVS
jgi:4-amino-4-deoxy-L-arabinose transferase-like glycosyltransferase